MQFIKIFIKKFLVIISGKKVKFNKGSNFSISSKFGGYNVIGQNTWINGFIDYGSYIGDDCIIDGNIGKYCSISSKVVVLTGTHPTSKFVSTSPSFYSIQIGRASCRVRV